MRRSLFAGSTFFAILGALAAQDTKPSRGQVVGTWIAIVIITLLALGSRWLIGGEDWNGFVEGAGALLFWIAISICVFRLRPPRANYSAAVVVGTLLVSAFVYKGLQATEIFWGRPMGSTDDEISLTLEKYGADDASFLLAHHMLGNGRGEPCGDLCHIMREYTNIRDGRTPEQRARRDFQLEGTYPR